MFSPAIAKPLRTAPVPYTYATPHRPSHDPSFFCSLRRNEIADSITCDDRFNPAAPNTSITCPVTSGVLGSISDFKSANGI